MVCSGFFSDRTGGISPMTVISTLDLASVLVTWSAQSQKMSPKITEAGHGCVFARRSTALLRENKYFVRKTLCREVYDDWTHHACVWVHLIVFGYHRKPSSLPLVVAGMSDAEGNLSYRCRQRPPLIIPVFWAGWCVLLRMKICCVCM